MWGDSMIVGSSVGSIIGGLSSSLGGNNKSGESTTEDDQFLIPEEVVTYHDLCLKPTELSISLRVKSLASKGDAVAAEELLEAFKVSFSYHIVQPLICFMSHLGKRERERKREMLNYCHPIIFNEQSSQQQHSTEIHQSRRKNRTS